MSGSLLTQNVFALLGYIAFALAFVKLRGILNLHGVQVETWFAVSLWVLVALMAAFIANRRMFRERVSLARALSRATLICLIASAIFSAGFIAAASVSYN